MGYFGPSLGLEPITTLKSGFGHFGWFWAILGPFWDPFLTPYRYSYCNITVFPPCKDAYTIFGVVKKGSDLGRFWDPFLVIFRPPFYVNLPGKVLNMSAQNDPQKGPFWAIMTPKIGPF